jgi:hypothetical protein
VTRANRSCDLGNTRKAAGRDRHVKNKIEGRISGERRQGRRGQFRRADEHSNSPGTDGTNTAAGQLVNVNDPTAHKVTDVSGTPDHWLNPSPGGFAITGDKITLEAIGNNGGADNSNQEILPTDSRGHGLPVFLAVGAYCLVPSCWSTATGAVR